MSHCNAVGGRLTCVDFFVNRFVKRSRRYRSSGLEPLDIPQVMHPRRSSRAGFAAKETVLWADTAVKNRCYDSPRGSCKRKISPHVSWGSGGRHSHVKTNRSYTIPCPLPDGRGSSERVSCVCHVHAHCSMCHVLRCSSCGDQSQTKMVRQVGSSMG
jgi:hypothetical protein